MSLTLAIPGWDLALEGPVSLVRLELPIVPGVYAIVTPAIAPLAEYRLLFADETENLADRIADRHEQHASWIAEAGDRDALSVAWLAAPMLTSRERQYIVRAVIDRFDPPCNRREAKARWMAQPRRAAS
jgi:hypothetical protein